MCVVVVCVQRCARTVVIAWSFTTLPGLIAHTETHTQYTCIQTHAHAHTHCKHTRTRTRASSHIHTHTHTHAYSLFYPFSLSYSPPPSCRTLPQHPFLRVYSTAAHTNRELCAAVVHLSSGSRRRTSCTAKYCCKSTKKERKNVVPKRAEKPWAPRRLPNFNVAY